jgi:hypothetical protein
MLLAIAAVPGDAGVSLGLEGLGLEGLGLRVWVWKVWVRALLFFATSRSRVHVDDVCRRLGEK